MKYKIFVVEDDKELVNIGTLSAFIIVSAGILWMRKTHPVTSTENVFP